MPINKETIELARQDATSGQRAVTEWLKDGPPEVHAVVFAEAEANGDVMLQVALNVPDQFHEEFFRALRAMANAVLDDTDPYDRIALDPNS